MVSQPGSGMLDQPLKFFEAFMLYSSEKSKIIDEEYEKDKPKGKGKGGSGSSGSKGRRKH